MSPERSRSLGSAEGSDVHRTLYVESSAILRVLLEHDPVTQNQIGGFEHFFTSALTLVEVPRALARARREGRLSAAQSDDAQQRFNSFVRACDIAEIDREVRDRAALDFPAEPVRTLDAIHLATLVVFSDLFESLVVASSDDRVRRNARALGYDVVPEI